MSFSKNKYWEFYLKWKQKSSYSPILNELIHVTRRGWNHIVGKSKRRPFKDIARRLRLLKYAKRVVESKESRVNVTTNSNFIIFFQNVKIVGTVREVRVIVLRDKRQRLIFLSVMDRKIGVSHTSAKKA